MVFEKIELVLPAKTYAAPCIKSPDGKEKIFLYIKRPYAVIEKFPLSGEC